MEQYTLKLSQGTSYKLYEGTTLMPDAELEALFASNGSAYFVFDFDGSTPSSTTTVQIVDSTDEMIIEKTGVSISEDRNYKGTWSGATTFDSFETLNGKSLDEYQMKFLMGEIKKPVGTSKIENSAVTEGKIGSGAVSTSKLADGSVTGAANDAADVTGSKVALGTVGTPNLRDSAITTAKLADNAVTTAKITDANVTSAKLADSAVTTAKIANAAVTSGKLANGAVTAEKLGTGVGETLPVGSEIDYDGSTVPTGWQEIETVLYDGVGTAGDIDLGVDTSEFQSLKIFFVRRNRKFVAEVAPTGPVAVLGGFVSSVTESGTTRHQFEIEIENMNISNGIITRQYRAGLFAESTDTSSYVSGGNILNEITKVIGVR